MDISLVVMAAGLGSRFGGVKQLASVGPNEELIIDYSVHDALKAGFNKIVFILRHEIFEDFMDRIGRRMETRFSALGVKWEYVFQELVDPPEGRSKPWGTGQAILACRPVLHEPFAVINADDYYGKEAYERAYEFLSGLPLDSRNQYGMVGFILKNTLSDNGGVTRGICAMNKDGYLTAINETHDIVKTEGGAEAEVDGVLRALDTETLVSMNMWMFTPEFIDILDKGFFVFRGNMKNAQKDEYLLPDIVDQLLRAEEASVKVLSTNDRWFGVTYREDLPTVRTEIKELHVSGVYNPVLYEDIDKK